MNPSERSQQSSNFHQTVTFKQMFPLNLFVSPIPVFLNISAITSYRRARQPTFCCEREVEVYVAFLTVLPIFEDLNPQTRQGDTGLF